jgi:hypothetical protein
MYQGSVDCPVPDVAVKASRERRALSSMLSQGHYHLAYIAKW